ncbi:MAG: hypothetical protein IJZ09_06650 [Tidjanibacter sp.]|nr:hypothetical protein [Tidjanibacter sp.]
MKIRDLRQYIESLCGTASFEKLGTNEDTFLSYMYGTGQELEAAIGGAADFASHSEEQLFYEFVQNAYDANATALMFFINEDYLVVLNNGDPFYTDKDIKKRHGQLYSFLAKGKSSKYSDAGQLGKYGQGSKLLYTLLTDKTLGSNSKQLIKVIKYEHKAPYLLSWNDTTQLQNLLLLRPQWNFVDPENEEEGMLVAKILYSYYPISPGVDDTLFSFSELSKAVKAFESLVDPKRNMNRLQRGTALIIPLGKGQYESIIDEENINRVLTRLGGFSSLTSDKDYNKGKHIDHIYVFGKEVEQHPVKSISVEFTEDDELFEYQFAFNPIFANEGYVNFFKGLPILETKYGLGFIVDSQQFDVDNSRQRITDSKKTGEQLRIAFRLLLDKIVALKTTNIELFNYCYDSILATDIPEGEDFDFIRSVIREEFANFLKENVRSVEGEYVHITNAQYTTEKLEWISLEAIGSQNRWIDSKLRRKYEYEFNLKGIIRVTLAEILRNADSDKLVTWILSLSQTDYENFHSLCVSLFNDISVSDKKLFKSSKGNVYSPSDIRSAESPIMFYCEEQIGRYLKGSNELEYISLPITLDEAVLLQLQVNKINAHQDLFATNPSTQECACAILKKAYNSNKSKYYTTIGEIAILSNRDKERVAFNNLFLERPTDTTLYDHFVLQGYRPSNIEESWCRVSPEKQWFWTKHKINLIKALPDWAENPHKCLKDISTVYSAYVSDSGRSDSLELYLDDAGIPTDEKKQKLTNGAFLTDEEYEHLREVFPSAGIVSRKYVSALNTPPFKLDSLRVFDLHEKDVPIDNMTLTAFFKMKNGDLLSNEGRGFHVAKSGTMWTIEPLQSNERNYIGITEEATRIDAILESHNFFRIDKDLVYFIPEDKRDEYKLTSNSGLARYVINSFSRASKLFLLPVIDKCNEDVKGYYFANLGDIDISSPITLDSEEWAIIDYGKRHSQFRNSIFKAIYSGGQRLPDSIISSEVVCNGQVYSVYDLDEDVKIENDTIESFLALIPAPVEFKNYYYEGRETQIDTDDLYDQLCGESLTIPQMLFCLDYLFSNECEDGELLLSSSIRLSNMLDAIKERNMVGFNRYFKINDFDINKHIFADKSLLNPDECLPNDLDLWFTQNHDGYILFEGAITADEPHIKIRQAFLDGVPYDGVYTLENQHILSCLRWISNQNREIIEDSNEYLITNSLIKALKKGFVGDKYLLKYVKAVQKDNNALSVFKLEMVESDYNILFDEDKNNFARRLLVSAALQKLIASHIVYKCDGELVSKYKLDNDSRWRIDTVAREDKNAIEWDNQLYKEWFSLYRIRIMLSKQDVVIHFTINRNGNEIFSENQNNAQIGYSKDSKFIILQYPTQQKTTVIKTLEQSLAESEDYKLLYWFQKPFMALQGMFLNQFEQLEKIAEEKGLEVADFISEYTPAPASKEDKTLSTLTAEQKRILTENIENVVTLCEEFSGDDLSYLKQNIDKIKEMMSDEKDEQSQVRQIIGYIGELIYEQYLKEKLKVEYEFSADKGVGQYDFKYTEADGHIVYVDVKTNLYSLKEGNSPFYLHRMQNGFMHENPRADYRIVRVSLKDLNLANSYSDARDVFGKDQNPRENENLKKRCQRIAKNYWQRAGIEEFRSDSPEYAIRIEKK